MRRGVVLGFFRLFLEFVFGREGDSLSYVRLRIRKRTRLKIWNLDRLKLLRIGIFLFFCLFLIMKCE